MKDKRIDGISNIEDHSDRQGMHIEIDVKREASASIVLNNLFNLTQLQTTFGAIMLAIVDGVPKILNLKEMLTEYVNFQQESYAEERNLTLKRQRTESISLRA